MRFACSDNELQDSYELLTDREKQVLQLLAEGMTIKEVAATFTLGVSTVEAHRLNLMQSAQPAQHAGTRLVCRQEEDSPGVMSPRKPLTKRLRYAAHAPERRACCECRVLRVNLRTCNTEDIFWIHTAARFVADSFSRL
jgi:hypothetical protein